jgi:RNA polymerase sigma-70 factor (ECF subfamily)
VGERGAFRELVERYRSPVLVFVRRMVGDNDRAEDIVQETFVRVLQHLHRYRAEGRFRSWLYTIASNTAKNELRRRSRSLLVFQHMLPQVSDDGPGVDLQQSSRPAERLIWHRYLRETVHEALRHLPADQRNVLVLRELEGLSYREISCVLGLKAGTVKSRLSRARNRFVQVVCPLLKA